MGMRGLQKQVVSYPLGGGVDEGTEDWLVQPASHLEAVNVRFGKRGRVGKRFGEELLSSTGRPLVTVEAATLVEHQGTLLFSHPSGTYALSEHRDEWRETNKCAPRPSRVLTDAIVRDNNTLLRPDIAVIGDDLVCVAWEDASDARVKYAFFDVSNGKRQMIVGPTALATDITGFPRLLVFNSGATIVLAGVDTSTGGVRAYFCNVSLNYTFAGTTLLSAASSIGAFDICEEDDPARFALCYNSAGSARFGSYSSAGAAGTVILGAGLTGFVAAMAYNRPLGKIVALSTDGEIARINGDFSGSATISTLFTPTPNDVIRGTISLLDETGKMFVALSGNGVRYTGSGYGFGTDIVQMSSSYTATRTGFMPTYVLAGRAGYLYDPATTKGIQDVLVPMCEQVGAPAGIGGGPATIPMPVGVFGRPVVGASGAYTLAQSGRFLQDKIDKSDDTRHVSHFVPVGDEMWMVATVVTDINEGSIGVFKRGVDVVRARVFKAPAERDVTSQSLRIIGAGSGVTCYDGQSYAEMTPPPVTYLSSDGFDTDFSTAEVRPSPSSGMWTFKVMWRWMDARGNVHRGAPSASFAPADISSAGPPFNPLRLILPAPDMTAVNGDRGIALELEVYQSYPGVDEWRLCGIVTPEPHPTEPSLVYVTTYWAQTSLATYAVNVLPWATVLANRQLYTDLELAAYPAPPLLDIVSTQSRLWGLSAEDRLTVVPTKPIVAGYAPEFAPELATAIPAEGGECVGLASLGDRVVVFKRNLIYVLFGDPGDANGEGATLQTPRLVPSDVGCVNARSIVEGPFGVAFQSDRGFYLLDRSETLTFIGEPVLQSIGDLTVTSAVLVPTEEEVRWTLDSSLGEWTTEEAISWSYRLGQWSTWNGIAAIDACMWRSQYVRLVLGCFVYKETVEAWADSATAMDVTTAWLRVSGMQGYQRFWRAQLLGRHFSGGLKIHIGFNYNSDWADEVEWTQEELEAIREDDNKISLQVGPSRQKVESIRFRFEEIATNPDGQGASWAGQGLELVALDLTCGVKRGLYKNVSVEAKR